MTEERPKCLDGYTLREHNIRTRIQTLRLDIVYHIYLTANGKQYLTSVEYEVEVNELLKLQFVHRDLIDGIIYPQFADWDGKDTLLFPVDDKIKEAAEFMYNKRFPPKQKTTTQNTLFTQNTAKQVDQSKQTVQTVKKTGVKKLF